MSVHALPLKSALPIGRSGPNQYMIPWAHPSPHRKRHLDRLSRFCTDDRRVSLYFAMGRPFPLKIAASYGEIWTPSNTRWLGPPSPQPKRHLDRFSRFCRAH